MSKRFLRQLKFSRVPVADWQHFGGVKRQYDGMIGDK
jgi:hypothetical protein